jgi:hypothetical protein
VAPAIANAVAALTGKASAQLAAVAGKSAENAGRLIAV